MAAVLPRGERSLGPLWGPYPREEPGEPDGHPTACQAQCQMGWLWLMACAPVCRPYDLSCTDFLACPSEVTVPPSPQKPKPLTLIRNKTSKIWRKKILHKQLQR